MAIGLRGITNNNGSAFGAGANSVTPPTGTTSGDLCVLVVVQAKEGTTAVGTPTGWTRKSNSTSTGTGSGGVASVFYKYPTDTESAVSVNTTGTAAIYYFTITDGPSSGDPFDQAPVFGTFSASPAVITSFTPSSGAGSFVVYGMLAGSAAVAGTTPTGWTAGGAVRSGAYENGLSFYDLTNDGSTATGTCSSTLSGGTVTYPGRSVAFSVKTGLTTVTTTDSASTTDSSDISATPGASTDSGTTSDSSALYQTTTLSTTDSASLSESSVVNKFTSDSATLTETSSVVPTNYVTTTDTAAFTDSSSLAIGNFPFTTDSASLTEGTTTSTSTNTRTDSASVSDVSALTVTHARTDSSSVTDSSSLLAQTSTTDVATTTDASLPLNTNTQITANDAASLTDSSIPSAALSTTDSALLNDGDTGSTTWSRTDSANLSETSRINQALTDSATLTDSSKLNENTSEVYAFSDSSNLQIKVTDSGSLLETSQPIAITTSDSAGVSENSSVQVWSSTNETLNFNDGPMGYVTRPIVSPDGDTFTLSEAANKQILPRYTEDIVSYKEPFKPNRNFRVIAQDHFTREFIHWDLPLDNIKITYSLTGPNILVGQISSEMESIMTLDPPLVPDRTWLHLEEDGVIRGSFILTPFVDSPGNQVRQIEAEGFSAYPHWVYYEGDAYTGIQVDPADMIRKIWSHVQSYTDGNLGVQVSSTKTPIKLGEPPEAVNFTTSEGVNVSFNAGPYTLNYWSVTNCGDEIDKLCKETPIDYIEYSYWNSSKNDVIHKLILGYPRVGTRRTDLVFREGENLAQLIPSYQGSNDNYASDVVVIGAGNGPSAVRAITSGRIGLLRKVNVIQNQDITTKARAKAIADFEFKRIAHSRFLIENITIDATHPNAPWGSFAPGDDILVDCNVLYVGHVQDWYRITSYTYDPYQKVAQIHLAPSDSFTYGSENVDPYDELPTAGFAKIAQQQDFTSLFTSNQATWQLSQLQAFVTQNTQMALCNFFNKYPKAIQNGQCLYWWWTSKTPVGNPPLPKVAANIGPLSVLADVNNFMIIGRTDYGHLITGDNIVLVAQDGTIGQQPNSQSDTVYPNPYYVPKNGTGGNPTAKVQTPPNPNPQVADIIQHAVDYFNQNGLQNDHCLVYNSAPALLLLDSYDIWHANPGFTFLIGRNIAGGLDAGNGVTIDNAGQQPSQMQFAAAYILQHIQKGLPMYEDWSWDGEPFVVSQYNDTLQEKYSGYHNMSVIQFLSLVIQGTIT